MALNKGKQIQNNSIIIWIDWFIYLFNKNLLSKRNNDEEKYIKAPALTELTV